ncbi:dead deah box helicase [Fusarium sporotrichioides]|uniref:Dead deah box helicase n=1 Tax=Fusarium sporotrichioides TaxID=5514 RepID=A0A395SJK7_FUSSP|nr:dead deah box helicase [Fusarium sporotrichioides]
MRPDDTIKTLRDWYQGQSPLTVDIVGDFAGHELFAIHGESLIRYCLTEAKVDLGEDFQLLHAMHSVEKLLSELKRRDCNFDILFFRDHENLCVPQQAVSSIRGAKYRLTRRILIQHFIKSNLDFRILEFASFESNEYKNYLSGHATQGLIEMPCKFNEQEGWELFDIVDGRVFFYFLRAIRSEGDVPSGILEHAHALYNETFRGRDPEVKQPFATLKSFKGSRPTPKAEKNLTALPFSHPVLEDFLKDVRIGESEEIQDPSAELVFEDLRHWHANKHVNQLKGRERYPIWVEKNRQKRMQLRMADVVSYAASLTSSAGKTFNRETIVKVQAKLIDILNHWRDKCNEFEKVDSPIDRYLKALDFQSQGSSGNHDTIKPEIQLYLCHVLMGIWNQARKRTRMDSLEGLYLVSMIWSWLGKISKSANCTPNIANAVQEILKALAATPLPINTLETPRALPFSIRPTVLRNVPELVKNTRLLQLEHGGPYMDRRFDSQPDARVQFEPDALQRDVLDCIDANESILVVAPTSAGKTFISFYAMKKVLEESDDGVSVYVAPTKALVNQIAAEIEARFSKSYRKQTGKSIWAVHTRDYRINNPSQCQILVTVPHMLQIMLLSPTNAVSTNSWSRRVKRIIFDEVHCIGQADDGVVWEQLLLLAPCPIIALSATVGNPNELRDWLATSQAQKGYDMKMVVHGARYSDLRKFTYEPPKDFAFEGLSNSAQLPVPGLDEGGSIIQNFRFVHPVVALKDRNRSVLDDVNLEARDCLRLWKHMRKTFPATLLPEIAKLDPTNVLTEWIEKQHVIEWEKDLKAVLRRAMKMENSPFPDLQESLEKMESPDRPVAFERHFKKLFPFVCDPHKLDALPALVFNYDRSESEQCVKHVLLELTTAERNFKEKDQAWRQRVQGFDQWKKQNDSGRVPNRPKATEDDNSSKLDLAREEASEEVSRWESFNPEAPLDQFSFAGMASMQQSDFDGMVRSLNRGRVASWLIDALRRGLGVHHAESSVETLFRRGYLRVVVATGTLALGINMPCKTVVFSGDSVFLSPQNYRQASGRAGRRGFDLLGNIVINGIAQERVHEIMSSRLPALRGQFPASTTLILRLLVLLDGTGNCDFAVNAVNALLSQTRLYLGGPDAEISVKHHLRFSIEYLRRQNLLSAKGAPINFAGLVGHLYFTENAVFAFHSLLRGGYFRALCEDIENAQERVLRELMLVLSHLFSRIPIKRTPKLAAIAARSSSEIFLRRLPEPAEKLLISHNQDVLSIFKDYVNSYINQHLGDKPDRELPLTKVLVGPRKSCESSFMGGNQTVIRSPFVALSGFGDDFTTINELCSGVRGDVFLEESAISCIPIWPHDTDTEFNAYIYDFFKHGSMKVLVRDNHVKQGDVWFHLKDFSLVLKTIVTSLKGVMSAEGDYDPDDLDDDDTYMEEPEVLLDEIQTQKPAEVTKETAKLPKKGKPVADSWDDDSEESEPDNTESYAANTPGTSQSSVNRKGGLILVLKAFKLLEEEFGQKFYKIGA